jgi:uncharacterized BrkB/YihY/UPF0761 family membrane protein
MKTLLLPVLVSTVVAIGFWSFGLAHRVWPAHPFLATSIFAAICAEVAHLLWTHQGKQDSPPK